MQSTERAGGRARARASRTHAHALGISCCVKRSVRNAFVPAGCGCVSLAIRLVSLHGSSQCALELYLHSLFALTVSMRALSSARPAGAARSQQREHHSRRLLSGEVQCSVQSGEVQPPLLTRRRQALSCALVLLCTATAAQPATATSAPADGSANAAALVAAQPRVTGRVFLDFAQEATDGGAPLALGRVVVGLYGDIVPVSAALFSRLVAERGWVDAYVSELRPGEFIMTTAQSMPSGGVSNPEAVLSSAFQLPHARPGTVSLSASGRPTFRITTGPGPAPVLDGTDIVLGRVLEGMDFVAALARQSTFAPREGSVTRTYNSLAGALGDGRAATARASWSKPQRRLFVADAGVLPDLAMYGGRYNMTTGGMPRVDQGTSHLSVVDR